MLRLDTGSFVVHVLWLIRKLAKPLYRQANKTSIDICREAA